MIVSLLYEITTQISLAIKFHVEDMSCLYVNASLCLGALVRILSISGNPCDEPITISNLVLFLSLFNNDIKNIQYSLPNSQYQTLLLAKACGVALSIIVSLKLDDMISWRWLAVLWQSLSSLIISQEQALLDIICVHSVYKCRNDLRGRTRWLQAHKGSDRYSGINVCTMAILCSCRADIWLVGIHDK